MLKDKIETKLKEAFSPTYLQVVDESHLHIGHANYKPGGESHFNATIVSATFQGLNRVQRHQKVYKCLQDELKNGVHALSLTTLSPEEAAAQA